MVATIVLRNWGAFGAAAAGATRYWTTAAGQFYYRGISHRTPSTFSNLLRFCTAVLRFFRDDVLVYILHPQFKLKKNRKEFRAKSKVVSREQH
mmetsp:Transcript_19697/g.33613  ORF Transcript_19697/g.33613 Transcript_19697/m.33613 type:complete len:93 (-) Transcript_19697:108-386(-)